MKKDASTDSDRPFRTEHLAENLRGRSVRGGAVTLAAQGGKTALNIGATMVLARLLTPEAFGLIAMVVAVTGFIQLFKDLGLSMATVQRAEITRGQVNALFWINAAVGGVVAAGTAALAPLVARFYGDPRLAGITAALAGAIFLSGLAVQHRALLKRQMRFTALAVVDVGATGGGVAAALLAAWLGVGYWALVILQLVTAAGRTAIVWSVCRWRPGRPSWAAGTRSMLAYGGHLTGFRVVNYFARNADDVLIGRYIGAASLGLYNKAYKLLLAPIRLIRSPISSVVLPALSRLQSDPERFRGYARRALAVITFLSMPFIAFSFAEAERIILFFLGPQWIESARIFQVLAVAAFIQSFNMVTGWSYMALDQTNRWLRWGFIFAAVVVTSFVVGLPWGAYGVAVAYTIANYVLLLPAFAYCFRTSPLRMADVFRTVWRPAVAAGGAAGAVLALNTIGWNGGLVVHLAASGLLFLCAYLLGWLLLPGGSAFLGEFRALISEITNRPS